MEEKNLNNELNNENNYSIVISKLSRSGKSLNFKMGKYDFAVSLDESDIDKPILELIEDENNFYRKIISEEVIRFKI